MSETESFESVMDTLLNGFTHDVRTDVLSGSYKMIAARLDRLKAAHDREIAQARDPQRLRGTKPDTFDGAIEALREFRWQHATNDEDAIPYINAVKEMHDREIRDVSQREFSRGMDAGQHSMDAEHRAVAMRLQALPLDGRSVENFSNIARAVNCKDFGWKANEFVALRDELVRLMGGVSDGTAEPMTTDAFIKFIEEDTRKLVSESNQQSDKNGDSCETGGADDTCDSQCRGACAAGDGRDSVEQTEVSDGRTANDCGGDSRGSYRGVSVHMDGLGDEPTLSDLWGAWKDGEGRITDELRKWASDRHCKGISHTDALNIGLIADHIDEQFDRICKQQEAVLQSTIDGMVGDRESDQLRIEKLVEQRDAARARTDELSDELLRTRRERDELQRELRETKLELESLRARIAEDANDHAAWQIKIQELKAKLDALDAIRDAIDG